MTARVIKNPEAPNTLKPAVWLAYEPLVIKQPKARRILRDCARDLLQIDFATSVGGIAGIRKRFLEQAEELPIATCAPLLVSINVLCDLRGQGWEIQVDRVAISVRPPCADEESVERQKARVRAAHIIERDAQLLIPTTRKFVRQMERRILWRGEWRSIYSLMRDGRELASELGRISGLLDASERAKRLRKAIDPYVQVVEREAVCEHSGLRLGDIWRYFRHTWTTTYQSTPGRKLFFLIRDRSAPSHPVIGIGALGSAIVQLSVRDEWIGWTGPAFVARLRANATDDWAKWVTRSLESHISSLYLGDFLKKGIVSRRTVAKPDEVVIAKLRAVEVDERAKHQLFPSYGRHKAVEPDTVRKTAMHWRQQAESHLFRSKRAGALADLLEARLRLLKCGFTSPDAKSLLALLEDSDGVRALRTILRYAKASRIGVDMMDITVCGAVAPYNRILGGKLVSLLMASPAVVEAYRRRYRDASSIIASSMAGRAVSRTPNLVLLGTTSLYAAGASQYNRLRMEISERGASNRGELAYLLVGQSAGYGSYHFSRDTMASLEVVLRRNQRGRPVNSIFGEGVNPKLRKVRSAFDAVGLPSDALLQHGSPRLVYAVPLATNFRDVLVGFAAKPKYLLPMRPEATERIADFWRHRWLANRILRPEILADVASHSLAYPIQHGARVQLPDADGETGPLFAPGGLR